MSKTLQIQSALLYGLLLCLASASHAQTVTYGEARSDKPKSEDVDESLRLIGLNFRAILKALPATLSGTELETARKHIYAAISAIGHGAGVSGAGNPFGDSPIARGPSAGGPVTAPSLDLKPSGDRKEAVESPVGRYQISSWTLPPPSGQGTGDVGAFVIDTQTGTIWKVMDGYAPKKLGQLKE